MVAAEEYSEIGQDYVGMGLGWETEFDLLNFV